MPPQASRFSAFLFAYYAHAGTFATYASLFFAARGMSAPQIGVLISLNQVTRIFGPFLWGWVADHSGQRLKVLRVTALGALAATCGLFFADSFIGFFAVMLILSMFPSAHSPLAEALLLGEMRGDLSHYGRVRMWGSIGFIAAVLSAGHALDWWTVEALPWLAAAVLACVLWASLMIREPGGARHHEAGEPLLDVLRRPEVIWFFAGSALMCGAHMALNAFYSLYLEQAGYSKSMIGAMWSIAVICEVAFFYYQAPVFKRFGARAVMMCAYALAIVRFPMIATGAASVAVLMLAQLMHAATFGAHHSASVMTMQRWFSGPLLARGQALYMSLVFGVGGTTGALLMSYCWDKLGPASIYHVAAVMALLGCACSAWSFHLSRR